MSAALPPDLLEFERYSLPDVECKLSAVLDLAWDSQMQDWDLVNANPDVLPRVMSLFAEQSLSEDERFSAMCLAVASYDEILLRGETAPEIWSSLVQQLALNPRLYLSIVWYWAQPGVRDDESFAVSAAMAEVWELVSEQVRAGRSRDA